MYGLQKAELIMSIIASAITIAGFIVAAITLIKSAKEFSLSNKRLAAEKAIDGVGLS